MCGIVGVFNREGSLPVEVYDLLFKEAEKRGEDGFGLQGWRDGDALQWGWHNPSKYSNYSGTVKEIVANNSKKGSVVLANCRAQPETEVESKDFQSIQPISKKGITLVHNGSVANFIVDELADLGYETKIDSEAIINAYIRFDGNMKKVMEYLVGGFAFILLDTNRKRLFCVNDYKPLAIGYVKGYGFIIHSEESAIAKAVELITDCKRCGTNVWEDYYYHWQFPGYTIREIDIDSGMERVYRFTPRFYHPVWNSLDKGKGEKAIVLASGGIDSGLTAWVLNELGYEVMLLHFDYGQKGEAAERWAVTKLSKYPGLEELRIIDLSKLFSLDSSCLIDKELEISTGTDGYLKTTDAWVSNRNQLFLSIATTIAEQEILKWGLEKVYIAAGLWNLTESGIYPDNSEYFAKTFFENVEYSAITGTRIKPLSVMRNIMKSEEWVLGKALGFPFEFTVSCDQPLYKPEEDKVYLCRQCGSTLLSMWAAEMVGVPDPRSFYDRKFDKPIMEKRFSGKVKTIPCGNVVGRLELPEKDLISLFERI